MSHAQAIYHIGFEQNGEQPIINVHTDPAHLEDLTNWRSGLRKLQEYFDLEPFTFDEEAFGYQGAGSLVSSDHVLGWSALRLALPQAESGDRFRDKSTNRLLPVVSTLSMIMRHLNGFLDEPGLHDAANPQLTTIVTLSNRLPLNSNYSSPLRANLSPEMIRRLTVLPDIDAAEERVRQALFNSYQYPDGHAREERFGVSLQGGDVSFDYPGDGAAFFATDRRQIETHGLTLNAANNDYPVQQIAIMGGLAALNDIALEACQ